ncbi:MAG: hypothetical protein ACKOVB_17375 [Terrabacter sp.]
MRLRAAPSDAPRQLGAALCAVLVLAACDPGPTSPHSGPPGPDKGIACRGERPYASSSAWNTPIGPDPVVVPATGTWQATLTGTGQHLTSDVDQYTIGVYCVGPGTARTSVTLSGYYSDYTAGSRVGHGYAPTVTGLPIPTGVTPTAGTDAQLVIWDQASRTEFGFWQFAWVDGRATATNGYAISTDTTSAGRFPDGLAGRGAGLPYLAGLVRPQELAQGRIDHALAFGYPFPSREHVLPASKSDGKGRAGVDLPEGTRLQLDPTLTTAQLRSMGVSETALPVARALQQYGMYVVDNSGTPKVYLQDRASAGWGSGVDRTMLGSIPWTRFRAVTSSA